MDSLFGTFVSSFEEREPDKAAGGIGLREDAKSTLRDVPTREFVTFMLGSGACLWAWARVALAAPRSPRRFARPLTPPAAALRRCWP